MKHLKAELNERKQKHLYRQRRIAHSAQQVAMVIDGHEVISFCSNDYLGLANDPDVKQAFIKGVEQYGVGSGAAHLISGHSRAHHQLELELAEFTGQQRALLFSTGYMANLAVAQSLLKKNDAVILDRLDHASLIDGGLLSDARFMRYQHNDAGDLAKKCQTRNQGEKLVMTDAVFSMDGDIANIPALCSVCNEYNAMLMIDDAHGFGVLGDQGRGTLEYFNLDTDSVPIYMATLGKAAGTAGAFVAGSNDLIETLIQKARSYVYTTASSPAVAEATRTSLNIIRDQPERRERLNKNIRYFKQCCQQQDLPINNSNTAIQPIIIGDNDKTLALSNSLFEQGLLVTAIRPPTVPEGSARLRITLSAAHSNDQIDHLIDALKLVNMY